jgi:hypothetical protein
VGRSEFVIADSRERLTEKHGARCILRANFMGSKYSAYSPDADGRVVEENKVAEVG